MASITGWLALTCLAVALFSGVVLAWFYVPDLGSAHTSLVELEAAVPGGPLARALHVLSAHGGLALALLHLAVLLWGPRPGRVEHRGPEGWASGLWSLAVLGLLAFSGRVLPWDEHASLSLQMAERFLTLGPARPLGTLLGPQSGPLLLPRLWLLHLGLSLTLVGLLAVHVPLRSRLRAWSAEQPREGRRVAALAIATLLLLGGLGLLWPVKLGLPSLDGAQPAVHSADWYLRWLQFLSLHLGPAALAAPLLLLVLLALTPRLGLWLGPGRVRWLWAGLLSALVLLSLLPSS